MVGRLPTRKAVSERYDRISSPKSDPLAIPELIQELKRRGHPEAAVRKVVYENPLAFWRQAANWQEWPSESNRDGMADETPAQLRT